jgi:outer membrane cobalamin receptor
MHPLLFAICCMVTIHVHGSTGAPIAGAHIAMHGARSYASITDAQGNAVVQADAGSYQLDASARGYHSISAAVFAHDDARIDIALQVLDAPTLRTIATVTVNGRLAPVSGEIPSVVVTRSQMDFMNEDRVVDALQMLPGATFTRPDGGSDSAVEVVSLRGPDPSESLIALDGQLLNDNNTGDVDLSRFPVAAFSSVNVTEGLGPEDSNGSNTFGGSINFVSLQPTQTPHYTFSISGGSFGQSEQFVNATGSQDRLGYAVALDNQHEAGYVNQYETVYSSTTSPPGCPLNCPSTDFLGSSVASHLGLVNLTWTFSQNANISARVFTLGDNRDQSSSINSIDDNTSDPTYGLFVGPGSQTFAQNIRAYQVRGQAPLGAGEMTASVAESDNGVTLNGGSYSPYDITHIDHRYDGSASWGRSFTDSEFTVGGYTRYEGLSYPGSTIPDLGQTINVLYARGGFQPYERLRFDGGLFESMYTSFGSNLDGRLGAIYTLDPKTSLRFDLGTGFRAPLLYERYQYPLMDLPQDANGVFIGQGSTGERPEHATEYELGISHQFPTSTFDFSLYLTNLRDPIEIYYPEALAASGACIGQTAQNPVPGCVSYNSNVGNAVYEGAEARYVAQIMRDWFVTAMYGLNVAYPKDLNAEFSNPTSGANLVDDQQFPGIAQQQGSLEIDYKHAPWHAGVQSIFTGNNNELNQGPFTIVNAAVGFQVNALSTATLSGTNLFSDVSGKFTKLGGGVPYLGVGGVPLATNALFLYPVGVRFTYTVHV